MTAALAAGWKGINNNSGLFEEIWVVVVVMVALLLLQLVFQITGNIQSSPAA